MLSLWRDGTCAGTFRLSKEDVGGFVDALVDGLRDAPGVHFSGSALDREAAANVLRPSAATSEPTGRPGRDEAFVDWAFGGPAGATAS